jgi:hypothetical protein
MMQSWLWPLVPGAFYFGRHFVFDQYKNKEQFIRTAMPLTFRWHMLNMTPIGDKAMTDIVKSLFRTAYDIKGTVIFSVEFMDIQCIANFVKCMDSCREFAKEFQCEYELVATIREPVSYLKSVINHFATLNPGLYLDKWDIRKKTFRFLKDEEGLKPADNAKQLFDIATAENQNLRAHTKTILLENARWDIWDRIIRERNGGKRAIFLKTPGGMPNWDPIVDILHPMVDDELRDRLIEYYRVIHAARPHVNALLERDKIVDDRLKDQMERISGYIDGEFVKMAGEFETYFAPTRAWMDSYFAADG